MKNTAALALVLAAALLAGCVSSPPTLWERSYVQQGAQMPANETGELRLLNADSIRPYTNVSDYAEANDLALIGVSQFQYDLLRPESVVPFARKIGASRVLVLSNFLRTEVENRLVTSSYLSTVPVTRRVDVVTPPPPGVPGPAHIHSHYVTDFETVSVPYSYTRRVPHNIYDQRAFYYRQKTLDDFLVGATNAEQIVTVLQARVARGDPEAQYSLGGCYQNGYGVETNAAEAVRLVTLAANAGHAEAMNTQGWYNEIGYGMKENLPMAAAWYRKAADAGSASALLNLGICYLNGRGVGQSRKEARRLFARAASAPDALALYQDISQMAAQGYARSEYELALCHQHGIGVKKDAYLAEGWFQKAAQDGCALLK